MLIRSVSAVDLRNLTGGVILDSGLNILTGDNGEGKTNWLEAVFIAANGRSFRTSRMAECVRFGRSAASVTVEVRTNGSVDRRLSVDISEGSRRYFINSNKCHSSDYAGNLCVQLFTSGEVEIIRGGPELRRRFIDEGIVNIHPPFARTLTEYHRILKQKNALLANYPDSGRTSQHIREELRSWNERLAETSAKIHRARERFVARLSESLENGLLGDERFSFRYCSSLEGKGDLANYGDLMAERLELRMPAELAAGHSLIGPHRDDLEIHLNGIDVRKFGSSGEQRSGLLMLLLAQMEVFHSSRAEYPVFLIDDVDAELDYERIGKLLGHLAEKTQTIVTTSKESFVERFGKNARTLRIRSGTAV